MTSNTFYFKQRKEWYGPWHKESGGGTRQHLVTKKPTLKLPDMSCVDRSIERCLNDLALIKAGRGHDSSHYYLVNRSGPEAAINYIKDVLDRYRETKDRMDNTTLRLVKLTIDEDTLETKTEIVEVLKPE